MYSSTILNSYSTGKVVSTNSNSGGLVGGFYLTNNNITDSFYDSDTSGKSDTVRGTPRTTAQMKTLATFTDISSPYLNGSWDFNSTWNIDTSGTINDGYPYLK